MKKFIIFSVLTAINIAQIRADECFSVHLGFPCCQNTQEIIYSDNYGDWGVENNSWCGIKNEQKLAISINTGIGGMNIVNAANTDNIANAANTANTANTVSAIGGSGWAFNPWSWWGSNNGAINNDANTNVLGNTGAVNTNANTAVNGNTNINTNANANAVPNVKVGGNANANTNANVNANGNTNANANKNANANSNANINRNANANTNANANRNVNTNNNQNKNNKNANSNSNTNNKSSSSSPSGGLPNIVGGKTGKTTGYWDCCVASCSWDANVPGAKPVRACRKNGVSLITEELWKVKSVCDNGEGYMCNNNQPIVINDKLAYGFAASHEKCCTCQRLQFTSGNVKGKQMIVQITNTGSDLGSNHFDLQIPGAGVGIFNGCTKQWGAPNDGWGRRYGGVTSKSQCSQLPSQLRAGCEWRFGWFEGSDNPDVVFERVRCPKALTDITGCILPDESQQKKVV